MEINFPSRGTMNVGTPGKIFLAPRLFEGRRNAADRVRGATGRPGVNARWGVVSFGDFSLDEQRKVTGGPGGR